MALTSARSLGSSPASSLGHLQDEKKNARDLERRGHCSGHGDIRHILLCLPHLIDKHRSWTRIGTADRDFLRLQRSGARQVVELGHTHRYRWHSSNDPGIVFRSVIF